MARFTSIFVTIVLAAIFIYPTTGRENQQKKYLLVQISETMEGKARQANFGIGGLIGSQVSKGFSALKDKVKGAFDNAAQENVKKAVGVVLQPSNIPVKTGSSGNSNGNMG